MLWYAAPPHAMFDPATSRVIKWAALCEKTQIRYFGLIEHALCINCRNIRSYFFSNLYKQTWYIKFMMW